MDTERETNERIGGWKEKEQEEKEEEETVIHLS